MTNLDAIAGPLKRPRRIAPGTRGTETTRVIPRHPGRKCRGSGRPALWYPPPVESLRIIRLWAAAAWSDGELHPFEAAALQRLIDESDDLSPPARHEALGFLEAAPQVDPAEVTALPEAAREGVYRAALGIVSIDKNIADDERAFLRKLRESLGLDEATLKKLENEAR